MSGAMDEIRERPTVLVVEDHEDVRLVLRTELEDDFTVLEAPDGQEGLRLAVERMPDLVLTDILMPLMDGIELCRRLKADLATSHIPVVMLTARGAEEHEIEGLESGADDYITKPFSVAVLKARVRRLTAARRRLGERLGLDALLPTADSAIAPIDRDFLERAIRLVADHLADPGFGVDALAKGLFVGRNTLHRKLVGLLSLAPGDFIRVLRLNRARQLLEQSDRGIGEIAYACGFSEPANFTRGFKAQFGMTPSECREARG